MRRLNRLNGWQRLWLILAVLYAVPVVFFVAVSFPREDYIESSWAWSVKDKAKSYAAYSIDLSNLSKEDLTRLAEAQEAHPEIAPEEILRQYGEAQRVRASTPGQPLMPNLIEEKVRTILAKSELGHIMADLEKKNPTDDEVISRLTDFAKKKSLKEYSSDVLGLEQMYRDQLDKLPSEKLKVVGFGFLAWLLPITFVYVLGVAVGWIYHGFKKDDSTTPPPQ